MRIALFGLPGSRKGRLAKNVPGLQRIDDMVANPGVDGTITVFDFARPCGDGYSCIFPEGYDVYAFLDVPVDDLKKNGRHEDMSSYSHDDLVEWRNFEIAALSAECYSRETEFVILDDDLEQDAEFLSHLQDGSVKTSIEAARTISDRVLASTDKPVIILCDGDGTLSVEDLTLTVTGPDILGIFDNDRYTTYQFWRVRHPASELPDLRRRIDETIAKIDMANDTIADIRSIDGFLVVVTAGLKDAWQIAAKDFADMIEGSDTSGEWSLTMAGKGLVARHLREAGRTVIALGDHLIDSLMLNEADHGYAVSHGHMDAGLKKFLAPGTKIRQPAYNRKYYDNAEIVESIHTDSRGCIRCPVQPS